MSTHPNLFKYRAWTGVEMIIVQTLCFNDKGCIWYGSGGHMGWSFVWPNAQWTKDDPKPDDDTLKPVMRWTGLVDKNGVDIWEGDILSNPRGKPSWIVEFGPFPGWEGEENLGWRLSEISSIGSEGGYYLGMSTQQSSLPHSGLVLGNIHQNPDLLKS